MMKKMMLITVMMGLLWLFGLRVIWIIRGIRSIRVMMGIVVIRAIRLNKVIRDFRVLGLFW